MEKDEIYTNVQRLRNENEDFNNLILEIDCKIQYLKGLVYTKNLSDSNFHPTVKINIKVKAIMLSQKDKDLLLSYLYYEYFNLNYNNGKRVKFSIKKCFSRKEFRITTHR